jgi:hypothetical protein
MLGNRTPLLHHSPNKNANENDHQRLHSKNRRAAVTMTARSSINAFIALYQIVLLLITTVPPLPFLPFKYTHVCVLPNIPNAQIAPNKWKLVRRYFDAVNNQDRSKSEVVCRR